jgi:hypothetical protein
MSNITLETIKLLLLPNPEYNNIINANKYYLIFLAIILFTILQNSINNATISNNNINNANINSSIASARNIHNDGYDFAEAPHDYHHYIINNYNEKTIKAIYAISKSINDYQNN